MTEKLAAVEYSVGEPTNYTPDEDLEDTVVYFSVGVNTEAVARSVARDLGGVDVQPMPADPPVESLGNGSVLVVLGNDMANKDLVAGPPAVPSAPTSGAATTTD